VLAGSADRRRRRGALPRRPGADAPRRALRLQARLRHRCTLRGAAARTGAAAGGGARGAPVRGGAEAVPRGLCLHAFEKLRHYGLFEQLFPATDACLSRQEHDFPIVFVSRGLDNTDRRILAGKSVVPHFLFAVLLWEPVRLRYAELLEEGASWADAMALASHEVASGQQHHVAIPKRFGMPMREIWALQPRLERRQGRRPMTLIAHPRFRAAYDFLLLRAEAGEVEPGGGRVVDRVPGCQRRRARQDDRRQQA
jgi:hypothetical protein